jgi:homoaconitase/3-isopropylmalate dehydratase large subunit
MAQSCSILVCLNPLTADLYVLVLNVPADRHLVHEVTSPVSTPSLSFLPTAVLTHTQQAFEGLRNAGRRVRRPDCTLATTDHVGLYESIIAQCSD